MKRFALVVALLVFMFMVVAPEAQAKRSAESFLLEVEGQTVLVEASTRSGGNPYTNCVFFESTPEGVPVSNGYMGSHAEPVFVTDLVSFCGANIPAG